MLTAGTVKLPHSRRPRASYRPWIDAGARSRAPRAASWIARRASSRSSSRANTAVHGERSITSPRRRGRVEHLALLEHALAGRPRISSRSVYSLIDSSSRPAATGRAVPDDRGGAEVSL